MFSRYDRDALVEVINRYLEEEITAFRLDEQLSQIAARTKDETVQQVVAFLWYHYDDVADHKVVASKEEWDYLQRLLLLLKSDAELVEQTGEKEWTARQAVAIACMAIFVGAAVKSGFGSHLFFVTVPLGGISMLLAHWRSCIETQRVHEQTSLLPFASVAQLLTLRRKVTHFVKAHYPVRLGSRRIRGPVSEGLMWIHSGVGWLLFSPVALAFQMLPEREYRWKVAGA
jgi:hypothetical protein